MGYRDGWGLVDVLDDAIHGVGKYGKNVGKGIASGAQDIVVDGLGGLIVDLVIEPADDLIDGDLTLSGIPWRAGQALGQGVQDLGSILGGAEKILLSPVPGSAEKLNEGLAAAYREVIDEPIATAATAASLADSKTRNPGEGWFARMGNIFEGQTWSDAHRTVEKEHRSLGQALALMSTDDIEDEREVAKFQQSKLFIATSSTIDVVAPFLLDPALVGAKGLGAARTQLVVKPIKPGDDIAQLAASRRIQQVVTSMEDKSAAEIRHEFFPNHPMGADLSSLFADARSTAERTAIMRSALGDLNAVNTLQRLNIVAANRTRRLQGDLDALRAGGWVDRPYDRDGQMYLLSAPDEAAKITAEIDRLHDVQKRNERRAAIQGVLSEQPRVGLLNNTRVNVTRSDWYQSKAGTPLRVVFQMRQHGMLNLDDQSGDIQIGRMLDHSALPQERRDHHRSAYINARTSQERQSLLEAAEQEAVRSVLSKHGITEADQARILTMASKGKAEANTALKSRAFDGDGRSRVELHGDGVPTHIPLMVSQNANIVTLTDVAAVERVARRYSPDRLRNKASDGRAGRAQQRTAELSDSGLEMFYRAWKPATLLRVAYPLRVVGEEQLRLMAMFGVMSTMRYARNGVVNKREDLNVIQQRLAERRDREEAAKGSALTRQELRALREEVKGDYETHERIRGFRSLDVDGYAIQPALGGRGRLFNQLIDSKASFDKFFGRDVERTHRELDTQLSERFPTGEFRDGITPDSPDWSRAWLHAVNKQIGSDSAARLILSGKTDDDILRWLQSPEGAKYARELHGFWRSNPEQWLGNLRGQVEAYLPTPNLKAAALEKSVTADLATRELPSATTRPIVHGEVLSQHMAGHPIVRALNKFVDVGFRKLASEPTNILSRSPAFNHVYGREVERQIRLRTKQAERRGDKTRIDQAEIDRIEQNARTVALAEVKRNLYDLAEDSDLSHLLRYISPFYGAWQEVLTVWGRIAVDNPTFAVRMHTLWEAPDRAGLVTEDEYGQEHIILPLPDFIRDKAFFGALKDIDSVDISKRGLNLVLGGLPGVGPPVAVAVSELTKDRPDIQSMRAVDVLFPYGVPEGLSDAVLPTTFRNLARLGSDVDGTDTRNWYMRIYMTQLTDYRLGKRSTKPDPSQIYQEAKALQALKTVVSFVSPGPTTFNTPYQLYIDTYRAMLRDDPATADEKFYTRYGSEFFGLTASLSRSINGVPPTLEAWKAYKKHQDIIEEFPEYGGLIVGAEGAGDFNRAVYDFQKSTRVAPGDSRNQREDVPLQEAVQRPDVRAGWLEWDRFSTAIDQTLDQRGLTNITQRGAEDLRQLKRDVIAGLGREYPAWLEEFGQSDSSKWTRRINALERIANDPSMSDRDDMLGLREYLDNRRVFTEELATREFRTLSARANADLAELWEAATSDLVRQNVTFASLYHRWLESDTLEGQS